MPDNVKSLVLTGATAITPFRREQNCTFVLNAGKIAQMGRGDSVSVPVDSEQVDLSGHYVLPGFIDTHVHGGLGHDFTDDSPDAIEQISRFHASHGTTSMLAAVYPQPPGPLAECLGRLRDHCELVGATRILEGIHLEGPFLNWKMHGAIRPDYIWPARVEALDQLMDMGGRWIRVMTIAPEVPGAMEVLRAASMGERPGGARSTAPPHRLYLSLGHSMARYEQIAEAIDNGLEGITHIFNAMVPMHHRKPGVLVGALLRDELFVEVIADAVHVSPAMLQLLLKIKSHDKILLITDAIRAAGQPDGTYDFSDQKVLVRDGRAYLADSPETLAGSVLTLDEAVRTMVRQVGASLEQAAQMASLNAARVLGWKYRRGILAVGKDADLVVLDSDLQVKMTVKAGRIVYKS
jgi:N-acetylglucosamine-6-phosphate deacetylase